MKGVYAILRRFSRGLYVFSSMVLLVLLALLFRDAGGVMWRSICLALFIGAVLYEAMWRSDRQSCPEVTGLMWFPAVLLCIPLFLGGLVRGFVMWQWPAAEVHMVITGLPYALLAGGGLSVLFLAGMTVEAMLRHN
ncbi:TPA: hypothetical protein N3G98_004763 [Salmonella enterica subsp. enterica serovar Denver]|nr:hypothetical protein [Salmonella enterica subsp. enterica serovar Denver]ECD5430707.1 hypothetical protein [Salmonella enterica subsp. enterica serovar Denver]HCM3794569.1 hypothetical protein [Salmonella enterica subsp. enterica serovar Denver]